MNPGPNSKWILVLCGSIILTGCRDSGDGKKAIPLISEEPEVKWATEMAGLFLTHLQEANFTEAGNFVVQRRQKLGPGSLTSADLRDLMGAQTETNKYRPEDEFTNWQITAKLLSPKKDEVSMHGIMEGLNRTGEFKLFVVKEKDEKWRVDSFSFRSRKKG